VVNCESVQAGDKVIYVASGWGRGHREVRTVARLTATQLITDGNPGGRFRRRDGIEVCDRQYGGRGIVKPATPDLIAEVEAEQEHRRLVDFLDGAVTWKKQPLATLRAVADIVRAGGVL